MFRLSSLIDSFNDRLEEYARAALAAKSLETNITACYNDPALKISGIAVIMQAELTFFASICGEVAHLTSLLETILDIQVMNLFSKLISLGLNR